ncbi:hypothetical protein GCM10009751_29830 [Myceligenerans crystallogenes]|uniref:DUF3099 domain-containing protein n=1 Tax=Myceligenerans crystallogenes TaxID=316335 RepID=A0ABN2NH68_9MICO
MAESVEDEQARRTKQYLIQMAIRMVCFVGAVVALTNGQPIVGWALAGGAIVLPYTAVIFVNAPNRKQGSAEAYIAPQAATLPAAAAEAWPEDNPGPGTSSGTKHVVIDGDALIDDVKDEPVERK